MRRKSQYLFVVVVVAVVALYFILRSLFGGGEPTAQAKAPAKALPSVQAKLVHETVRPYDIVLRGRTESARTVVVRSATSGIVAQTPDREGSAVTKGEGERKSTRRNS